MTFHAEAQTVYQRIRAIAECPPDQRSIGDTLKLFLIRADSLILVGLTFGAVQLLVVGVVGFFKAVDLTVAMIVGLAILVSMLQFLVPRTIGWNRRRVVLAEFWRRQDAEFIYWSIVKLRRQHWKEWIFRIEAKPGVDVLRLAELHIGLSTARDAIDQLMEHAESIKNRSKSDSSRQRMEILRVCESIELVHRDLRDEILRLESVIRETASQPATNSVLESREYPID
jgi:hypothetical protein